MKRGEGNMKWILVVLVFNVAPVKTDLVFSTLDECLEAEHFMRGLYSRAYNSWLQWAETNKAETGYPQSEPFNRKRTGLENPGTCIPHQ